MMMVFLIPHPLIEISSHRHISSRLIRRQLYGSLTAAAAAFVSNAVLIQQPPCVDIQPPCQSIGLHIHAEKCRKLCGCSFPLLTPPKKGKPKSAPIAAPVALSKAPFPHAPAPTQGFPHCGKGAADLCRTHRGRQHCWCEFPW